MSSSYYFQQVYNAWDRRNGTILAEWLSLRNAHARNKNLISAKPEILIPHYYDDQLAELVTAHLRGLYRGNLIPPNLRTFLNHSVTLEFLLSLKCVYALSEGDPRLAYKELDNLLQIFIKIFQYYKEENWLLPVMNSLCLELRLIAGRVDSSVVGLRSGGGGTPSNSAIKPREALEKAAETMMSCFRICSSDNRSSEQDTKKWGMLSIVNQLFKLYFRINKLHLMRPLIRAIDSSPLKDKFPLSQLVTYRYYVGRKAMFDSDYTLANESLTFAFQSCHKMSKRNKHLILIYLVPLKMLLGYLPTRELLEKYDLLQLWEVGEAVRCGNSRELTRAIEKHQEFYIKSGIYLILERLRLVTYRNLFKKVFLITENNIISLEDLLIALRFSESEDIELDEANCILANLIHQGKIKGYISHSHQKVVLSKTDAFPKLSSLA